MFVSLEPSERDLSRCQFRLRYDSRTEFLYILRISSEELSRPCSVNHVSLIIRCRECHRISKLSELATYFFSKAKKTSLKLICLAGRFIELMRNEIEIASTRIYSLNENIAQLALKRHVRVR